MNRRVINIVLGAILVLVLFAGYFLFSNYFKPQYNILKISGQVIGVDGNTITIKGIYESEEKLPAEIASERDIKFKVNSSTTYKKTEIRMPTREELIASGKATVFPNGTYSAQYSLDDQPKVESTGSLEDIKNLLSEGIRMEIEFSESIHNSRNPSASNVYYTILVHPIRNSKIQ